MTPKEAAQFLGISQSAVYALAAPRGPIPCVRPSLKGKRIIFDPADVQEYRMTTTSKGGA